jgi:hypothetical protein
MHKIIIGILSLLFLLLPVTTVSAHMAGQPPFFRVNGIFSNFYPVPMGSYIALHPFPQDLAPDIYRTGTPIQLAFDFDQLSQVVPPEVINKTNFIWDFGDGTIGNGQKNNHAYKKPGSYVLSITADTRSFEANAEPQVIQSVILHVVDDPSYVLPKTKVYVNGVEGKDIKSDWIETNLTKPIHVEGKVSELGTSKNLSYQWDFGDGTTGEGIKTEHTYASAPNSVMVVFRVKDENGFIIDSAAGLVNNPNVTVAPTPIVASAPQGRNYSILIIFSLCVISLIVWLRKS